MANRRFLEVAALLFCALCFCLGWARMFGEGRVFLDDAEYWVALYTYFADSLKHGTLALWNPYMNGGEPFYHLWSLWRLLDPLNLLFAALGLVLKTSSFHWYHLQHILKLPVCAAGTYLVWREIFPAPVSPASRSSVIGLHLAYVLFLNALLTALYLESVFVWTPYILYCAIKLLGTGNQRWAIGVAYFLGIQIGPSAYHFVFSLFFLLTFLGIHFRFGQDQTLRAILAGMVRQRKTWAVAAVVLLALCSPMLVSAWKHTSTFPIARLHSQRLLFDDGGAGGSLLGESYAQVMRGGISWSPARLLSLLFQYPFFDPRVLDPRSLASAVSLRSLFSYGIVPLVLVGLFMGRNRWKKHFGALFLVSFFCTAGTTTPVHEWFCFLFPPLRACRNTNLIFPFVVFCYTYFLILGFRRCEETKWGRRVLRPAAVGVWCLLCVVAGEGTLFTFYSGAPRPFPKDLGAFRVPGPRELAIPMSRFYPMEALLERRNAALTMLAYPPAPLMTENAPLVREWSKVTPVKDDPATEIPLFGIRDFIWTRGYRNLYSWAEDRPDLFRVLLGVGRPLFEFRASALLISDAAFHQQVRDNATESTAELLARQLILPAGTKGLVPSTAAATDWPGAAAFSYQVASYVPSDISLVTRATRSGYLLFWDGYDSEWDAYVDGHRVPVYRANAAFKAIALPGGQSHVRFAYAPGLWFAALVLYLLALAGVPMGIGVASVYRIAWRLRRAPMMRYVVPFKSGVRA